MSVGSIQHWCLAGIVRERTWTNECITAAVALFFWRSPLDFETLLSVRQFRLFCLETAVNWRVFRFGVELVCCRLLEPIGPCLLCCLFSNSAVRPLAYPLVIAPLSGLHFLVRHCANSFVDICMHLHILPKWQMQTQKMRAP